MDKESLFIVGGCDSIGVPYTRDNKNNIGFFEMLVNYYKLTNYNVTSLSFFSLDTYNTSDYISEILENNYSFEKLKKNQITSIKTCKKKGFFPLIELPKKFLNHYQIDLENKNLKIVDMLRNNKSIFVYSSGVNDFLAYNNIKLFSLLKPQNLKQIKLNSEQYIKKCIEVLESNIKNLILINPNMEIIVIGLFIPTNLNYVRRSLKELIDNYNNYCEVFLQKYHNVYFIKTNLEKGDFMNIDFHPNKQGHHKIFEQILKTVKKEKR